jgi:hypothetical protein
MAQAHGEALVKMQGDNAAFDKYCGDKDRGI